MLPKGTIRFEEWLRVPFHYESPDPRFEVRRAQPAEYERIYALVDEAFGVRRPPALYEWLYQRNPRGRARCWIAIERSSGRLLGSNACWPWPLARGDESLEGMLNGDLAVLPGEQRRGIAALRYGGWKADPLREYETVIAWANEKSFRWLHKLGDGPKLLGPLPEGRIRLSRRHLAQLLGRRFALLRRAPEFRVEQVQRFDSAFDAVTESCMAWNGLWSPHDAEFLNWRYLDHPARSYRALALLEADEVCAYAVLSSDGGRACLMEFVAPEAGPASERLLEAVLDAGHEAGCRELSVFAPPAWRHWPTLERRGLAERPPHRHLFVFSPPGTDASRLESLQILPSDCDDA